ncbi:MAG TPA: hypothetical protein VGQ24_03565 [Gemmatimonadales bacterium]|nr:hypothetical protein [Gemmatimonadales bacterium]
MSVTLAFQLLQIPPGADSGVRGLTLSVAPDSLGAAAGAVRDTLTQAPLPGGLATLFRSLFQVPQWIQIGGALVGALAALAVARLLWRRRRVIGAWLRGRTRQAQIAVVVLAAGVITAGAVTGAKTWDYMQHDNGFCTGCHIMERPFRRFAAGAGRHEDLKCHDCHQQSIWASTRQMYLWVAERPEKIGAHAPVPNLRCRSCHAQGGKEKWEHVLRLAGHKVHFESDSSALKDLACVQCHGAEVHRFVPSARTCTQSGCHEKQVVRLAGMAKLPEINCVTCHRFTTELPGLASRDSAVSAMVPQREQCRSCHQMTRRPQGYDLTRDPHKGSCGSCHDVHAHTTPADAKSSCKTCHADLSRSAFHQGASHRRVAEACTTCHLPHQASVDASDCVSCHSAVRTRGLFKAPMPFDTSAVLKARITPAASDVPALEPGLFEHRGKGDELPDERPPTRASPRAIALAARDSFPHPRHKSLPCLTCHVVNRPEAGLVFQVPRGCDLCHHQAVIAGRVEARDCARCHRAEGLAAPRQTELRVQVGARTPVTRLVGFRHDAHAKVVCADCHRPPSTTPPDSVRTCQSCHVQHHEEQRNCVQCHSRGDLSAAHPRAAHVQCDACHTPSRIAALVPVRSFCLTCHAKQQEHEPSQECTTCHLLKTPAEFRKELGGKRAG